MKQFSRWRRTSTSIRGRRSPACIGCSSPSRSESRHHGDALVLVLYEVARADRACFPLLSPNSTLTPTPWPMHHRVFISALAIAASVVLPLGAQQRPAPGAPSPDPRVGLKPGIYDAGQADWNMRLVSLTKPTEKFAKSINSDLAFFGHYVIQGSFDGFQVWDISDPAHPTLRTAQYCPASQSDVSVYKNLLVVSSESNSGRLDCGDQGIKDTVSTERIRGVRLFDISDLDHPKYITNVQTCRGSHTHSLLVDPKDKSNVYVYISGSAQLRSPKELAGCTS